MTALTTIEGIGPAYEEKLKSAGIGSCEQLLEKGASAAGRKTIEEASGMAHALVLKFVNHADLCRVKGVGGEYSELLEAAGVDSVPELAQRNAANLTAAMTKANEEKKLVRSLPSETQVTDWVAQAKELPRVVTH
jgi:predicted flap endonuclease-1-like 5' DNA nuclease